jgi:hypothetical protein
MHRIIVPTVHTVQAVQTPSLILPRDRGGGKRWGLEPSVAVEPSRQKLRQRTDQPQAEIERIERVFTSHKTQHSNTPILQHSISLAL